jgi:hypothetical protein
MGHIRLGTLPKTRKWLQVVNQLQLGADAVDVAASAAEAAEYTLQSASRDPAFQEAFWLLTQIPLAARGPDFIGDMRSLGLLVENDPSLIAIGSAFSDAVDRRSAEQGGKTDLGEMAQMAAVESLVALVGPELPSLFTPNALEVQRAIGRFSGGDRFASLAREFFTRLMQRSLGYYLGRELSSHIGLGNSFSDDGARSRFEAALNLHCREASRIVEVFAGGWYGKNVYQGDGLSREVAARFAPIAFKKLRAELRKRRDATQ